MFKSLCGLTVSLLLFKKKYFMYLRRINLVAIILSFLCSLILIILCTQIKNEDTAFIFLLFFFGVVSFFVGMYFFYELSERDDYQRKILLIVSITYSFVFHTSLFIVTFYRGYFKCDRFLLEASNLCEIPKSNIVLFVGAGPIESIVHFCFYFIFKLSLSSNELCHPYFTKFSLQLR